ncbi:MAG: sensor histidine kinase [Actinomycetota bacterium]
MTEVPSGPRRGPLSSIRVRLLAWFVVLLTLASAVSVFVVRQVLLNRMAERIDRDLVQETKELRALAGGLDPETGEPFGGRVRKVFETYLERNIPSRNEALITFVDGRPYLRSRPVAPYRLDRDSELVARWGSLTEPDRGTVDTPAGTVEYLAVPLDSNGETRGVFVVAFFRDLEQSETDSAIAGAAGTGVFVLIVGSLLAWRLAEMILAPVRRVRRTALSISESDLSRRIDVTGRDEISELAATFNEMLDRLEAAFTAQKKFIDDASHELRTPITIIRGHLETLETDPVDRAKTVELLLDEVDRMGRLVDDLVLLARSERPDLLDLDLVQVGPLTEELHAKASGLGEREWVLAASGKGTVVADRQRVTQAVMQLAQNAYEHTTQGDRIELGSQIDDGHVRFWVRDSGPGIDPRDQQRIFQRFERAGTPRPGGAGLGLSIVQAIATAHHGDVNVQSRPGSGSTFEIVIPVDQPEDGEEL